LQALETATGKVVWRAGLGFGVQNAPVIAGNRIYLTSHGGEVYALE
jgi:outer membrane protein assembly factor BamB